jgi:hypothetical protein
MYLPKFSAELSLNIDNNHYLNSLSSLPAPNERVIPQAGYWGTPPSRRGCVAGSREYKMIIWGLEDDPDWFNACYTTPAYFRNGDGDEVGPVFASHCEQNWPINNMWGTFYVQESSCS